MEKILDLFPSLVRSPIYADILKEFMQSCDEHQAFSSRESHDVQPFISHINNQLNDPAHRLEGLVLLDVFLPQCSDQQFIEHGISWMSQCVRGIESAKSTGTNETAYNVLKLLLEMASNFQEMTKTVNSTIILKFSGNLMKSDMTANVQVAALRCVTAMIINYGAPCGSQRTTIEQFILHFADCKDAHVASLAARCFASLPLVGNSGISSTLLKARWLEQQQKTCYSMRMLLDQLFENIKEADTFVQKAALDKLPLELLTDMDPVLRVYQIADRFNNLTAFLGAMLTGAYPAAKSVLPDLILGIVCRGLAVNCTTLGTKSTNELLALSSVLPGIHVSLLKLLRSLILCLGTSLYPYGQLICKLTLQSLKWTGGKERRYGVVRRYGNVRVAACDTLTQWLMAAKGGSSVDSFADGLFDVLAVDVSTERTTLKLTVQPGKKSRHLRKELAKSVETDASASTVIRQKLRNQTANEPQCLAALKLLYWLLHSASVQLKPTLHKAIQEMALAVAFDLQRSSQGDLPIPYASRECRRALYELVTALTLNPHPIWPPPTQYSLEILAKGQSDVCRDVSGYCSTALIQIEKIIHPAAQSLEFPVSLEDMLKAGELEAKKAERETRETLMATPESDQRATKRSVTFEETETVKKIRLDDEDCIDLSSGEEDFGLPEYGESNASILSSNSNYQDLVLEDTDEEDKVVESTSLVKVTGLGEKLATVIEQIDLEEDENDTSYVSSTSAHVALCLDSPKRVPNGVGAKKAVSPVKDVVAPVTIELIEDSDQVTGGEGKGDNRGDKLVEVKSFQGLTDEEVVNLVAGDFCLLDD